MSSSQCYNTSRSALILYFALFVFVGKCSAGRQRICGSALTDVLASVCVNGFNYRIKRCLEIEYEASKTSPPDDSWYYRVKDILRKLEPQSNENNGKVYIEISSHTETTHKVVIRKRRQTEIMRPRGVADECCTNGFPLIVTSDLSEPILEPITLWSNIFLNEEVNFLAKLRRRRRGIVDECCSKKGCSYNELLSYCRLQNTEQEIDRSSL
ncbi:probable insulin-like peptide 4 [Musca vetustissima]|uniref:probable insulin-like peptide 4 n=1 Tax=Musca vetustissima TaxID=27455 RepID=UPI002AB75883|nr:probable insulin-like peptide 4 [Musca vetustissima]